MKHALCIAAGAVWVASGCAAEAPVSAPDPLDFEGPGIAIAVAPLTLAGISNAEYNITVKNQGGDTVFNIVADADTYGDGAGSVSFVGPCDAQDNDNVVSLELLHLYSGEPPTEIFSFQNPGVQSQTVTCAANEDVAVTFNMALLRQANQGFFDIAVTFSDIFCSAKFDCSYDGPEPIKLLFNDGVRDTTAVLGLACTSGVGDSDTHIYLDDIGLDCDGDSVAELLLDPSLGPGNVYGNAIADPNLADPIYQYAVYEGVEALTSGGQTAGKIFWNLAIGVDTDVLGAGCNLTARATASDGAFTNDAPPVNTSYPEIVWDIAITADGAGILECGQNPLNGDVSGVQSQYIAPTADPVAFGNVANASGTNAIVPPAKRIFATSGAFSPGADYDAGESPTTFDSVADADEICQDVASGASLGGSWRAFIADQTAAPKTTWTPTNAEYQRVGSTVQVSPTWSGLVNPPASGTVLTNAVAVDETGTTIVGQQLAWTGMELSAEPGINNSSTCANWTSSSTNGVYGGANADTVNWYRQNFVNCGSAQRFYCVEQ